MKSFIQKSVILSALCCLMAMPGMAQHVDSAKVAKRMQVKSHLQQHFKMYGFVRNYFTYDSRESISGTGDLYNYQPKDVNLNAYGDDLNAQSTFRFLALTTRIGLNITGYKWRGTEFGGKIEADFYAGLNKVTGQTHTLSGTAQFRLRQAYMTFAWDSLAMGKDYARVDLTMGQTWHPMASDLCDAIALNSGAPFGPFNRSPMVKMDARLGKYVTLTAAGLWQMQYISTGPEGQSAEYIAYSKTPEAYLGLSFHDKGWIVRVGADVLSIKPRHIGQVIDPDPAIGAVKVKVNDRITTASPFVYVQYKKGEFSIKLKSIFAEAGEHMNLNGGYGVSKVNADGSYEYTPLRNSSTWVSIVYGGLVGAQEAKHPQKLQGILFCGYVHNFGTKAPLATDETGKIVGLYIPRTTNMRQMYRITPALLWTIGKFQIGCEYSITAVQYGDQDAKDLNNGINPANGLAERNPHWIGNHRVQLMTKFNF